MTYVYREPGDSCFVVRSEIDEERDRLAAQEQLQRKKELHSHRRNGSATSTRSVTPLVGSGSGEVKKNKISLSAYKNKIAGGTKEETKEETVPKKEPVVTMDRVETKKQANGVKVESKPETKKKEELLPAGSKR